MRLPLRGLVPIKYMCLLEACDGERHSPSTSYCSGDRVTVFPGAKEETLYIPDVSDVLAKTA